MRVFSYKLVRDFGFAPNPFDGLCTLANCKPQVRSAAKLGDIVIGCGSPALNLPEKVIFAMRVDEKLTFDEYWRDPRFSGRKPRFNGSRRHCYGDNIYHREDGQWVQEDSHHSYDGGAVNYENLSRDTNSEAVLLGRDFVYWGGAAIPIPNELANGVFGDNLYPTNRSHRSIFPAQFVAEVERWFKSLSTRGVLGMPASWK